MNDKPKRRWYQFSLRGLMCLMLVIGIGLGWWNYRHNNQIRRHERVERAIQLIGECPDPLGFNYNPVPLIRAVNHLHSMGKEDAIKALRHVEAQRAKSHESLRLVIPLLFGRREPEDKLPAMNGWDGKYDLELDSWNNWIDMERDVPFHTVMISFSSGPGWNTKYLVEWAERDGRIRTTPLRPTDDLVGAADKMLERLQRDSKDGPEDKKWIAYHIRRQAYAALKDIVLQEQDQPLPRSSEDEAWEQLKKQCHAQNLLE